MRRRPTSTQALTPSFRTYADGGAEMMRFGLCVSYLLVLDWIVWFWFFIWDEFFFSFELYFSSSSLLLVFLLLFCFNFSRAGG
jgi:hypothetical protein